MKKRVVKAYCFPRSPTKDLKRKKERRDISPTYLCVSTYRINMLFSTQIRSDHFSFSDFFFLSEKSPTSSYNMRPNTLTKK